MKRFSLVCLLMLLLLPLAAQAAPTVTIEPEAASIPEQVVAQIVADYPDARAITFISHHTASEIAVTADESSSAAPSAFMLIALTASGLLCVRRKVRTA